MIRTSTIPGFDPYGEDTSGFWGSIGNAVKSVGKTVAKPLSVAAKVVTAPVTLSTKLVGATLGKVPIIGGVVNAVNSLALMPLNAAQQIIDGGRIDKVVLDNLKSALKNIKTVGPWAQTVLSFVPGVGTGISAAIGAGLALAEGQSISDAMIAAAKGALPGGAASQAAFSVASGAIQGKPIDQIALNALPLLPEQKKILAAGLAAARDIAAGKNVAHSVADRAIQSLPPQFSKAVQIGLAVGKAKSLQEAIKAGASGASLALNSGANMGPAMKAFSGLGKTAAGIQKAVGAAQAIQNNSPILKAALQGAVSQFASGSPEHIGFATAVSVLKQTAGNKVALGVARRALPNEAARQAFDSAIGVVSRTVSANPMALAKRAGSSFVPMVGKVKGALSPYQPNMQNAIDSLKRNPTLMGQNPTLLARQFGTSTQTVLEALKKVGTERLLPWRSMTPSAANFVQKWSKAPLSFLSHGTGDTAGLDESGTKYIVEKGDFPFKIAQKLTGNGNRWVELKPLNTDKKPDITKNVWVGEVLNLPASWQKPIAKSAPSSTPAASSQPSPQRPTATATPAPQISVAPGILQAKAIMAAWGKTDGLNEAGVSNYGSTAADLSTDFGSRDSLQLKSFQNWSNKVRKAGLVVDGKLGPKSLAALQSWAESRASAAAPSAPIQVSSGKVTTLPEIVIEASAPRSSGIPQLPPAVVAAIPIQIPAPVLSAPVSAPTPVAAAIPAVAPAAQPATPATVAAASPPASSGSKMGPALAGAALGGTLFGLPGAIIGGIAGAAIA